MGGGGNFKISVIWGSANKLKWAEKIDNSVMDPLQLEREEYNQEIEGLDEIHSLVSVKLQFEFLSWPK